MGTFGRNLRRIRIEKRIKSKDLAEKVGVTPSMISRWELKDVNPDSATAAKIAGALAVSVDSLLADDGWDVLPSHTSTEVSDDVEEFDRDITRGYKKNDVPVVSEAEASSSGFIVWSDEGFVKGHVERTVSRAYSDGDPRAIGFRVRGDSMAPRYRPGEVVIAQPRHAARDGDDVIVVLASGERLLKRAFKRDGGWVLHSENELYLDRNVNNEDVVAMYPIRHRVNA